MSVVSEEELQEIVEVVWMTALELPVEPGPASALRQSDYMSCEIRITGAWYGVVTVSASKTFLQHASEKMFDCDRQDVSDTDLRDSLTELTNMLGGSVKCLLPEICDLSLPALLDKQDHAQDDSDAHEWVYFNCQGWPLAVAVSASEDAQQAA